MPETHGYLKALFDNLRSLREKAGLTETALEELLILGPGWIRRFESGESTPSIDMLLAILREIGANLSDLLKGLPEQEAANLERDIFAEKAGDDIVIRFRYANFDAEYKLTDSTLGQFEAVIKTLRDGLARLASTDATQSQA